MYGAINGGLHEELIYKMVENGAEDFDYGKKIFYKKEKKN